MILVIDNYDSFTYNLVQYLGLAGVRIEVRRNDEIDVAGIKSLRPDGILLSPGPCTPKESGVCLDILGSVYADPHCFGEVPIFGVCLGMEAMGHVSGTKIRRAKTIMHGKASMVEHDGEGFFQGIPSPFRAIRYHSLVLDEDSLPTEYCVTARALDDGEIMGIRHRDLPIEGVQFHPESALSEHGQNIVQNFVDRVYPGGVPAIAAQ